MDARTLIRRSSIFNRDRTAVIANGRRATFGEMWDRGLRVANGLLAMDIEPKAHVGVLEENSFQAADLFVGATAANLVKVPLYARNSRESHAEMLRNGDCELLIVDEGHREAIQGIEKEVPTLKDILVRDDNYEQWISEQSNVDPDPQVSPDDFFIIRHTGGTTGAPKPVAITHKQWLNTARDWFYIFPPVEPGDTLLHIGPISHASGYQFLPVWAAGGAQVLVSGISPAEVLDVLEAERVAFAFMPPSLLNLITNVEGGDNRDFTNLKAILVGSAPITEDTLKRACSMFGQEVFYQIYGQTEAVPIVGMTPGEWFAELDGKQPLRAAGKVLPWVDLEIRGVDNQPLPIGQEGEIAAKCDGMMDGFYNDAEESSRRIVDGWVLTGDIGVLDHHGYLYLVDRKTDMIVSGGFNIYPGELENVIADHPAVVEVVAFGIPHEKWGETPMVICAVRDNVAVSQQEIIDLVSDRLGSYKKPTRVELRAAPLPKSPVGKLSRRAMRDKYWTGEQRRIAGA